MFQVKQAQLAGIFVDIGKLPEGNLPEVAVVGRSNVGKSSLINKVMNRKNLARSSSTPGKTRTINYYQINGIWYLVDLPGYGFARVSKAEQEKWGRLMEKYLSQRSQLRGVIHLLDIRHRPSLQDILMQEWLQHYEIPRLLVATKADKISRGARAKHISIIKSGLQLGTMETVICFSAKTGDGLNEVQEAIEELLKGGQAF